MVDSCSPLQDRGFGITPDDGHADNPMRPGLSARPNTNEIRIMVMGSSGAGKSSLINLLSGAGLKVSTADESQTSEIEEVSTLHHIKRNDLKIVLVDCPGVGDTKRSASEIFNHHANWLAKTYAEEKSIHGVLYLYNIESNRNSRDVRYTPQILQHMIGEDFCKRVLFVTTHWQRFNLEHGRPKDTIEGWERNEALLKKRLRECLNPENREIFRCERYVSDDMESKNMERGISSTLR